MQVINSESSNGQDCKCRILLLGSIVLTSTLHPKAVKITVSSSFSTTLTNGKAVLYANDTILIFLKKANLVPGPVEDA